MTAPTAPTARPAAEVALSIDNLSVTFYTDNGAVDAVRGISYSVRPGEVLAVVGESGSGKSVTARAAIGLTPSSANISGSITINGTEVADLSEKQWVGLRGNEVAMVFQEPGAALDPLCTAGSHLVEALRAHPQPGGVTLSKKAARAKAIELLAAVGLPDPERRVDYYPHELSGGQKQRVVIATAIALRPKVIIADEPTTALDVTVQAEILDLLRDLRDQIGCAIVLITHNMGVVAQMADRVVVMNRGEVVEEATVTELFNKPTQDYTKALLAAVPRLGASSEDVDEPTTAAEVAEASGGSDSGPQAPTLVVKDLVVDFPAGTGLGTHRAVDRVSFAIAPGETVGLVGESGSGKSTIARCVARLQKPTSGSVEFLGTDIGSLSERKLRPLRGKFGFVFQDPATALNPRMTVGQCVAEPLIVHKTGSAATIGKRVAELLDGVQLPADTARRFPHELSGGQRQRANLARALALAPELLVADEPTSALDVSVQAAVLDLFEDLQREWGFACLFISHDLAVVERVAQRVAVLRGGAIVELGTRKQILHAPQQEYTQRLLAAVPEPSVPTQPS